MIIVWDDEIKKLTLISLE